jgi:hypothetical protein
VTAHRLSQPRDVEGGGGDVVVRVEGAAVGMLGAPVDLDQGLDACEARRPRVAALGADPVDAAGSRIGAGLDAAVPLLDRRGGDDLVGRGGSEVFLDLGFEGGLVAL